MLVQLVNLDGADAIEEIYMENAQDGASEYIKSYKSWFYNKKCELW